MPITNKSHILGRKSFTTSINSHLKLEQNSELDSLFAGSNDAHISIMADEFSDNEVIISKGHPTIPSQGSWSIINEDRYLKVILHESNGVNSLVYKSHIPVFNTRRRNLYSINFINANNTIQFFVDGVNYPMIIDTSQSHYRTTAGSFTSINQTSDQIKIGIGEGLNRGSFTIYYDLVKNQAITEDKIREYLLPIVDMRTLPDIGKIVFTSDRIGNGLYSIFKCDADGTNIVTVLSDGSNHWRNPIFSPDGTEILFQSAYPNSYLRNTQYVNSYVKKNSLPYAFVPQSRNSLQACFNSSNTKIYVCSGPDTSGWPYKIMVINKSDNSYSSLFPGIDSVYEWHEMSPTCHPLNDDVLVYIRQYGYTSAASIVKHTISTGAIEELFSVGFSDYSYTGTGCPPIFNLKWNKQGTKIGFNYFADNASKADHLRDMRACMMNADGSGLEYFGFGYDKVRFLCFSPDGTEVLLQKVLSGPTYTNKSQLVKRNLLTKKEQNITNYNANHECADWI